MAVKNLIYVIFISSYHSTVIQCVCVCACRESALGEIQMTARHDIEGLSNYCCADLLIDMTRHLWQARL